MPIHDQSYRHYGGGKAVTGHAWLVIASAGLRTFIRRRAFLGLMLFALGPFVVRAVQLWISSNYPQASILAPSAETFRQFLEQQDFFVFVITVYIGCRPHRQRPPRQRAADLPLEAVDADPSTSSASWRCCSRSCCSSRSCRRCCWSCCKVVFDGSFVFLKNNLFVIPAIVVAALLQVILASFTMLALSSLSKSSRYVGILYVGITFFTSAIYGVLYAITGSTRVSWISISADLQQVVDVVFRLHPRYQTPWPVSLLVIIGLVVLSISVLERRVRGVEVVT